MDTQDFIALAMLLPLIGTVMIWMSGPRPNQREVVTVVTAILTFLSVLQVLDYLIHAAIINLAF